MDQAHKKTLQNTFLFQDISNEEFLGLITCLCPTAQHFFKNEIIFSSGDPVEHLGIILSGTAHAYLEHINGDQTLMANLTPGRVFGEVLASTRLHQSPVTIYTQSEVTVAFIEYEKAYSPCASACGAHRIFLQNMIKTVGDKYFNLFDRINILSEKTLRARITAYLYSLSNRGENFVITIPFTKTMLADYLLANRSALSKELRKMENDGLIAVNGRDVKLLFLNSKTSLMQFI